MVESACSVREDDDSIMSKSRNMRVDSCLKPLLKPGCRGRRKYACETQKMQKNSELPSRFTVRKCVLPHNSKEEQLAFLVSTRFCSYSDERVTCGQAWQQFKNWTAQSKVLARAGVAGPL
jgi:hypothetical protein